MRLSRRQAPAQAALPAAWAAHWPPLLLAAAMTGAYLVPGAFDTLVYWRPAIIDGEHWRLFTGHFVHLGFQHFAWNVGTFVAMAVVARHTVAIGYTKQGAQIVFIGLAVTAALWSLGPDVVAYSGLSAILNGLFVPVVYATWRQTRDRSTLIVAAAAVAKIAYEAATGDTLFVDVPWPASAEAHLAGLLAGMVWVAAEAAWRRRQTPTRAAPAVPGCTPR